VSQLYEVVFLSNDVHLGYILFFKWAGPIFLVHDTFTSSVRCFKVDLLICVQIGSIWVHIDI
jgi:hypothetical protein